jgi:hypothetical protein
VREKRCAAEPPHPSSRSIRLPSRSQGKVARRSSPAVLAQGAWNAKNERPPVAAITSTSPDC